MAEKTDKYNGCLKGSIDKARDYARNYFVYGLKTKDELQEEFQVSAHTVENSTRNMRDWFQDCLKTRVVEETRKHVKYISLNCRSYSVNPLYKMWKACSFTTNDIVFFFFLLDYLSKKEVASLEEMHNAYYDLHRTDGFQRNAAQWWLKNKGIPSGIIERVSRGKYRLGKVYDLTRIQNLLQYYSEIAPGGVIGSFILDKLGGDSSPFRFKQHYIGQAFDSEILSNLLYAIKNERSVKLRYLTGAKKEIGVKVIPLKVYSSTQNGRQYLIAKDKRKDYFFTYRLDRINKVSISEEKVLGATQVKEEFEEVKKHIWGVSFGNRKLIHVEFIVKVKENEAFIIQRLDREKRLGKVAPVENSPGLIRFSADVYDPHEMFPWLRTYIGRIVELKISDEKEEKLFWKSVQKMYDIYL